MELTIRKGCRFKLQDVEDGYDYQLDDSGWEEVVLPHDWAVSFPFDEKCSSGTGYLPGGTGWYRLHVTLPEEIQSKSVTLLFDGVYKHASVWCNNYFLGNWANGYTPFSFDISHAVRPGENVIAVRVSHEDLADCRWYTGSGIERAVRIRIQEKCHVIPEECTFEVLECDKDSARIRIRAMVTNQSDEDRQVVVQSFFDSENAATVPVALSAWDEAVVENEVQVSKPKLWSVEEPQLISWGIVVTQDGCREETVIRTGIRSILFDPDKGFFLNGKGMKIKGVCVHDDGGSFGNAVPGNVWRRRLEKLKAMGANTIRMAHNVHDRSLYDLCDEMGFLVIDEVFDEWEGPKNKWHIGHNVYPPKHEGYSKDYPEWHGKDVEAFVKANRNRPSVIMWSIGNEIDYPNDPYCHPSFTEMTGNNDANKPAAERQYNPYKPNAERLCTLAGQLCDMVRQFDLTRPVSLASAFPELSSKTGLFAPLDVIGYNYKEQFYEEDHKRFPTQPIFGSENSHRYADWLAVTEHDYISGQCLWTGIDFLGETRGWPEHGSRAGHLTTAGFEKPDYYFRQSLWSDTPMIKLATCPQDTPDWMELRRFSWNYPVGTTVRVEVYSNLDEVELFLNERSLGVKERDENGRFVYLVPFEAGTLKAAATAGNGAAVTDTLRTSSMACQVGLELLDRQVAADGVSVAQIEVTARDASGAFVPEAELMLHVSVEGAGELAHIDNGNLADITPFTADYRRTYRGGMMIYVRSTDEAGAVHVRVCGEYAAQAELTYETNPE